MVEVVLRTEKGRRSSPRIKFITLLLPALVSPVHQNDPKQRYFLLFYQEHVKKPLTVLLRERPGGGGVLKTFEIDCLHWL